MEECECLFFVKPIQGCGRSEGGMEECECLFFVKPIQV